jgi:UDP-N-acetylmuramyl pentapeptide phosphotransferase/UDP-N-acetylglucosamine-1-phosphate transferase
MSIPVIAVVALAVTVVMTPAVMVAANHFGIVDRPGALKPQSAPVPYLGGVAVFAGLVVGAAAGRPIVMVPLALALALGVADDRYALTPLVRLFGQLAIGIAVVVTVPIHLSGIVAIPALVATTVLVVNGVNLIDGLDALASAAVAAAAIGFSIVDHGAGRDLAVALVAALIGFLVFNRPPARVYLGDGGSYLLGAGLVVLLAASWAPGVATPVGVAALALVAVPSAEVAFAVVRRLRGRRSLVAGDRGHPYDRLVRRGWSVAATSGIYAAFTAVLAAGTVAAVQRASPKAAIAVDGAAALLLVVAGVATGALDPDEETVT